MNTSTLSAAAINGDESKMPLCDAAASHPEDSTESGDIPGISINQDTDGISMTLDNRQTTSETQRGKESLQGKSPFFMCLYHLAEAHSAGHIVRLESGITLK